MRLLVLTQKVDIKDDLLGFFHGWLAKLAPRVEKLNVIALGVGEYHLPQNTKVFSLGKNNGNSGLRQKIRYTFNFYRYIWRLRNDYDVVFVHMNTEYILLGGGFWLLWGKKIILWYAHFKNPFKLKIATALAHRLVTSATLACQLKTKKLRVLQQGIDTEKFKPENIENIKLNKILFLGRISPVKKPGTLIEAVHILKEKGLNFQLIIVGEPTPKNAEYFERIKKLTVNLGLTEQINFLGKISNFQAPQIYNQHDIFVNLTVSGSFDKTTLEAMSCGLIIFVSNRVFEEILPGELRSILMFREGDSVDLAGKIIEITKRSPTEILEIKKQLRQIIVEQHSLAGLIDKLMVNFAQLNK